MKEIATQPLYFMRWLEVCHSPTADCPSTMPLSSHIPAYRTPMTSSFARKQAVLRDGHFLTGWNDRRLATTFQWSAKTPGETMNESTTHTERGNTRPVTPHSAPQHIPRPDAVT